jgi:hypothetical protein
MANYEHGEDRDLAHVNFILNSWTDPQDSPLHAQLFLQSEAELANVLFEELLERLAKIIDKVDYLERYWISEEEKLSLSEQLLLKGSIELVTHDELDLAVFHIPETEFKGSGRLVQLEGEKPWQENLHRMALHNQTSCSRVLLQRGSDGFYFYFRADSLALCNRATVLPRRDLKGLAANLDRLDPRAGWSSLPFNQPRAALWNRTVAGTNLSSEQFLEHLSTFLQI